MAWEFLTIYWREMIRFVRFRAQLFSSLLQPALWMAFFGVAMSSNLDRFASAIPAPAGVIPLDYLTFMAAGVIAMTTLFTSLFGGMSLLFGELPRPEGRGFLLHSPPRRERVHRLDGAFRT